MPEEYPSSMLELERQFSSEEACRKYLQKLRWPDGFVCPRCAGRKAWAMENGRWLCQNCRRQASVTAGTIFQDSRLPLQQWFRAMWLVTSQKQGVSALGLQRELGLGSYKTAWLILHKLRGAMVRPGRDRLSGTVELDEAYWGGDESDGVIGRRMGRKTLLLIAAQEDGPGIGRIRLRREVALNRQTVVDFVRSMVEPGSTLRTDGLNLYADIDGYTHERRVRGKNPKAAATMLPRVHRVISLLKRWLLGTHQGAIGHDYLDCYLDEFTFRFNRRTSRSRGKLFSRLAEQAVQISPLPFTTICNHNP